MSDSESNSRKNPQRRRRHRWLSTILVLAVLSALCVASYELGFRRGHGFQAGWLAELEDLRVRSADYERQISRLGQDLVNLRYGARIDRESAEQVREEVVASEAKIAALEEDLAFYRSLMTPTATEQGLGIRSFKLYPATAPGTYPYQLVLQQLAVKHRQLQGRVRLEVQGVQGGEDRILPLAELSDEDVRGFRFRYFQKLEGVLRLPEGFHPARVDIVAETREKYPKRANKQFKWLVTED